MLEALALHVANVPILIISIKARWRDVQADEMVQNEEITKEGNSRV